MPPITPAIIIAAIDGLLKLIEFVGKVRSNNAITSAWTPEQRAQIQTKWDELQNSPAWQTDVKP